jgi:hypothetical protein
MTPFGFEPFPLRTKGVDFIEHPLEKGLGRGRWNPRPLKLEDLLSLSPYLGCGSACGEPMEPMCPFPSAHRTWSAEAR